MVVTGLTNDTEYTFILELVYDKGFISASGSAIVKATPVESAPAAEVGTIESSVLTSDSTEVSASAVQTNIGTDVAYDKYTFKNTSDKDISIQYLKFKVSKGECAYLDNPKVTYNTSQTLASTCATIGDSEDEFVMFPFADLMVEKNKSTEVALTLDLTDSSDDRDIQLSLVSVKDDADLANEYLTTMLEGTILKGKKTTDASLNYGFASIFDDVLNSLFNLFR